MAFQRGEHSDEAMVGALIRATEVMDQRRVAAFVTAFGKGARRG